MNIIISQKGNRKWISAIVNDDSAAKEFLQKLSSMNGRQDELVHVPIKEYPFFIIENFGVDFAYFDNKSMVDYLLEYIHDNDIEEDKVFFNLYIVYEDFIPEKPGQDYMGSLDHHHIKIDSIKQMIEKGIKSFIRM